MHLHARALFVIGAATIAVLRSAAQPVAAPPSYDMLDNQIAGPLKAGTEWRDRVRFMNESSSHYFNSRSPNSGTAPLFFPPVPPPLGSEVPILARIATGPSAPSGLVGFEGDLFYPLLAARLVSDSLPAALATRLQAYRSRKVELVDELRARIAELIDADPKVREQQLGAFAKSQEPRVDQLEAEAEKLRKDLQWSGVVAVLGGTDWRGKQTGEPPAGVDASPQPDELHREALNLRGAAFYQEGFSPAQRRLLLEASIELVTPQEEEWSPANSQLENRLLFFSPVPARIRVPSNLPAPVAAEINRYILEKGRLKADLLDALGKGADLGNISRIQAIEQLAAAQAGRNADLEALAEQVRRDLASLPNSDVPAPPPAMPAEIAERISTYRRHKVEVLNALRNLLVTRTPEHAATKDGGDGDSDENVFAWMRDGRTRTEVQASSLQSSVEEFNARQVELIGGLNRELAAIRKDLSEYVQARSPAYGGKSIDDLLKDFEAARQKQELWNIYRDYRDSVLMPGMAPGQRRLLLDAAAGQLALPTGETAP
jgi:hypothetical protein